MLIISSAVLASLSIFINSDIYLTVNKLIYPKHYLILETTLHLHTIVNASLQIDEFQTRFINHATNEGDRLKVERIQSELFVFEYSLWPIIRKKGNFFLRKKEEDVLHSVRSK